MVRIYYCRCGDVAKGRLNFGDLLTPYLYKAITGKKQIKPNKSNAVYFGAGSIIRSANRHSIIWGSGIMWKKDRFPKPRRIVSVRGPLTRQVCRKLGYACPEVYGDIGLIMPLFYAPSIPKRFKVGIIPHYIDFKKAKAFSNIEGVLYIDILSGVEKVINAFLQCEYILSSSLHGIIVPQAYSIPAAWVKFSNNITGDNSKYLDYYLSVGVAVEGLAPLPSRLLEGKDVDGLADLVKSYPNPLMPIPTHHIIKACPFTPGPHLADKWAEMCGEMKK